ncbi:MAG: hypothetical protein KAJ19_18455 [Gammaproteobacteria bacterium]|nr:hypothetical protein [Gammaproteobacteria bacterium]
MAQATITEILPGNHRSQFHVYLLGTGTELIDEVLIDPVADLGLKSSARLAIEMMAFNLAGFAARVEFDSGLPEDKMIWVLPEQSNGYVDFNPWGGLGDKSGLDGTGKIQLTTTGFGDGDQGSILLMVRHSR